MRSVGCALMLACAIGCDARFTDLRTSSAEAPAPPARTDGGVSRVLARGEWEGRAGHRGAGGAALVEYEDGALELRLDDGFSTSGVPGPVVILSSRESLGRTLDRDQDLELGVLRATSGAQSYSIPILDDGRRVAWVYCKPFGVEVARAVLAEVE